MSENTQHDLVIIGAGPAGYVAAIRASQLGLNVGLIEKEPIMGGTCLRVGCIPSKALLESSEIYSQALNHAEGHGIQFSGISFDLKRMMERKASVVQSLAKGIEGLVKKNKITRYAGTGRITGKGHVAVTSEAGEETSVSGSRILIATGSVPTPLPGIQIDGDRVGTSTEALEYDDVPENLILIGAGAIGLELGSVWSRLGSKVTVLEYLDRILPGMDLEMARLGQRILKNQGLEFRLNTKVVGVEVRKNKCQVQIAGSDPLVSDKVIVAVGRMPFTQGLGLEEIGVKTERGRILVDSHFQTNVEGIYAVGDVIPGPMLAHKAEEDGVACVEAMVNGYGHVDYNLVPAIVYTSPEIASVGKTQEQLEESGIPFKKGLFPFAANGRALAGGHSEGRVKILAHAQTDRVLGVHIVGHNAGELIAEAAASMTFGASSEDIARTCHAHPTLSETLKEAAMAVDKRAIHS